MPSPSISGGRSSDSIGVDKGEDAESVLGSLVLVNREWQRGRHHASTRAKNGAVTGRSTVERGFYSRKQKPLSTFAFLAISERTI